MALVQLDTMARNFLFPKQTLQKKIQVLSNEDTYRWCPLDWVKKKFVNFCWSISGMGLLNIGTVNFDSCLGHSGILSQMMLTVGIQILINASIVYFPVREVIFIRRKKRFWMSEGMFREWMQVWKNCIWRKKICTTTFKKKCCMHHFKCHIWTSKILKHPDETHSEDLITADHPLFHLIQSAFLIIVGIQLSFYGDQMFWGILWIK